MEFPAFGKEHQRRGEDFQESLAYIRSLLEQDYPIVSSEGGVLRAANLQPKPLYGAIPIGVTGNSQQSREWIVRNTDFWVTYPRPVQTQAQVLQQWRASVQEAGYAYEKPVAQSLYIDLTEDPKRAPRPMHLGFQLGREMLVELLHSYQSIGVNHVALVLKFSHRPIQEVIQELAEEVVPHFPVNQI